MLATGPLRSQARILVLNVPHPIIPGQRAVLHMHAIDVPCRIAKLLALVDKSTGAASTSGLRMLRQGQAANVELQLDERVSFDSWSACAMLNRLVLRIGHVVAAVGVGTDVLDNRAPP